MTAIIFQRAMIARMSLIHSVNAPTFMVKRCLRFPVDRLSCEESGGVNRRGLQYLSSMSTLYQKRENAARGKTWKRGGGRRKR